MTADAPARVFVVDDHPVVRESLRKLLGREADLVVCGEAATAAEALERAAETDPDLVLIDISLPDMSGIELARALRVRHPDLMLAMLSGHGERSHVDAALDAGAQGYILKGRPEELASAVRQVVQGEPYLSAPLRRG